MNYGALEIASLSERNALAAPGPRTMPRPAWTVGWSHAAIASLFDTEPNGMIASRPKALANGAGPSPDACAKGQRRDALITFFNLRSSKRVVNRLADHNHFHSGFGLQKRMHRGMPLCFASCLDGAVLSIRQRIYGPTPVFVMTDAIASIDQLDAGGLSFPAAWVARPMD
jgi:hypothetical protein